MMDDGETPSVTTLLLAGIVLLGLVASFGVAVMAQGHTPRTYEHPAAGQPDPYMSLRSPEGQKCCGGRDCKPREVRWSVDANATEAYIQEITAWVEVDLDRVIGPPPSGTPIGTIVICWFRTVLPNSGTPAKVTYQRCTLMGGGV